MTLKDGRLLGYYEFGDPQGKPVMYIHSYPDSGVALSGFEGSAAKRLGIRLIGPDRPGIGKSTLQPGRTVSDYPSELLQLIENLGLKDYRLLGRSGGTGYTLASAQQLPMRSLKAVGNCAAVGPWQAGLDGQSEIIKTAFYAWKDYRADMILYHGKPVP
jgi:pimeloyl-ACP methyl ester carboxylesterase